jgi:hypothetical protein
MLWVMLETPENLPNDPDELRVVAAHLRDLAKSQALKIEKLEHQLAGHPLPGRRFAKQICREGEGTVWLKIRK